MKAPSIKAACYSLLFAFVILAAGCTNDEPTYNNLPEAISEFIAEYYPNQAVDVYQHTSTGYDVGLKDGPTITFDAKYAWVTINGNGSPLPSQLLYDQLPSKMYEYLQQTDALNAVFGISRDSKTYTATLLKSTLTYDINTENLSGTL